MARAIVTRLSLMLAATVVIATAACAGDAGVTGPDAHPNKSPTTPPGDTFSLLVHVGTSGADGVSGATVSISKNVWTFITHGTGHDTVAGHQVDAGQGTTDANGDITFRNLPADIYHVNADAPGLSSGWVVADLLTSRDVRASVILKRAP